MFSLIEFNKQLEFSVINCRTIEEINEVKPRVLRLSEINPETHEHIVALVDEKYKYIRSNADKKAVAVKKGIDKKNEVKEKQTRNRKNLVHNEKLTIKEASVKYDVPESTIIHRKYKEYMTVEEAVDKPVKVPKAVMGHPYKVGNGVLTIEQGASIAGISADAMRIKMYRYKETLEKSMHRVISGINFGRPRKSK